MIAKPKKRRSMSSGFPWKFYVHPKATTIYIAEATSNTDSWQPADEQTVQGRRSS